MKPNKTAILFCALALFSFVLTLSMTDVAIEYMKKGLKLCATGVIPSLFPFMVISELLVASGVGQRLGKLFALPARLLFGVGEEAACACILGAVCGFPIGARTLCEFYDRGDIAARELERSMIFCNNPGSAFVISAVGVSLFGNQKAGILLYACLLLSALSVGIGSRLLTAKKQTKAASKAFSKAYQSKKEGIERFTSAIQHASLSMLTVCAYVAFFSSVVGCLGALLPKIGVDSGISAVILGFFELSSGVAAVTEALPQQLSLVFCGVLLGWSGLSVHFQVMTVAGERPISFKPYLLAKTVQGLLCGLYVWIALKLFPMYTDAFATKPEANTDPAVYACVSFFLAALFSGILCLFSLPKRKNRTKCLIHTTIVHTDK